MKTISIEIYDSKPISMQNEDGYMHATAMCQASGKKINNYIRNAQTKAFLAALSEETRISASQLIIIRKGQSKKFKQGTWVHPLVAINLAQWASPEFAVFVSKLVFDWRGKHNEVPKIEKQEDMTVRSALAFLRKNAPKGFDRPATLSRDQQATALWRMKFSIENAWPRSNFPVKITDYFEQIMRKFGVSGWHEVQEVDFMKLLDFIDNILPRGQKNQIILREHEDKNFLNDVELIEQSLYRGAKSMLNMIRERPVLEPAPNILRFGRN